MPTQETELNNLIINKLTKAQYDSITPNENELYIVVDDQGSISWGNISGTLADQTDLNTALESKADIVTTPKYVYTGNTITIEV